MDLFQNLALGFSVALSPTNLLYCFIGCFIGTAVGILPGIGPLTAIALLLPVTFTLSPSASLIMLAGIYYGSQYGGSTTAILLNLPGESSSAVTTIDGYQMARRGRAGPALATAALSSLFAGTVATLLIAAFALPLTSIALQFGSLEYFSLMVLGLVSAVALGSGSLVKAIAMVCFGLLLGLVGTDIYSGSARFTFGMFELSDGVDFVALAVGVFGICEILRNLEQKFSDSKEIMEFGRLMPHREDMKRIIMPTVRGTLVGSLLGILPGGGALLSSFAAYTLEKNISKNKSEFGHGAIEGVAAPESANNAGAQTSFIPMLTLGIPSNPIMALMIGAMLIQGIAPGPSVATKTPDVFWGLIASMWIGNLMLVILNLPLIGIWVKLLRVPPKALFPAIVAFCSIGVFSISSNAYDLYQITFFGVLGYFLMKLRCEPTPLILGFILGPMMEDHLRRGLILSNGDPIAFFKAPISAGLLLMAAIVIVVLALPSMAKKREEVFTES
jgi:TctA family transporter